MPNSDQLKYMKDKEPTPIRQRASTAHNKEPQPLILHKQPTLDERITAIVRTEVAKAMFAIGHYDPEPNIAEMRLEDLEALIARITAEEDEG